jgi:predicted nuclease with TOPRIM domain
MLVADSFTNKLEKQNEGLIERNSKLEIKLAKTQDRLAEAVKDRSRMESEADVLKREFRECPCFVASLSPQHGADRVRRKCQGIARLHSGPRYDED